MSAEITNRDNVAIIGLGKTGTAVGHLLRNAGYPVAAVVYRSDVSLQDRIRYTGGRPFGFAESAKAARLATCIFITTQDDFIAPVCRDIANNGGFKEGDKVIHMSGSGSLDLLDPARRAGALTACIHPIQSFADVESAIRNIPQSYFGVTAAEGIREWASSLVRDLGGIPFDVSDEIRPLYHVAACMASNYLTALLHMVMETYSSLGLPREEAIRAVWPLVLGTLKNIETKGTVRSLTGPISRGDTGTIEQHIEVLREKLPLYLPVYCEMGLQAVELAMQKKTISVETAALMKAILKGG